MADNINAEIIAVGTEILLGEITDTNSVYIARTLRDLGINVYFMTSVGDNELRIASAIQIAMSRAEVIIMCGGLGPTVDDMTRQGVAAATNQALVFKPELLEAIQERFKSFNVQMTENNKRQAYLPENAKPIHNPVGTAPSFIVESNTSVIISLPGVPREMKFLMQEAVVPYLQQQYSLGIIKARILKTAGIGESALDDMIGSELLNQANPSIGLAAHHGTIDVRLTAKAENTDLANTMLDGLEVEVRKAIGKYIFGMDDESIGSVLDSYLLTHSISLQIVEIGIDSPIVSELSQSKNLLDTNYYMSIQDYVEQTQFDGDETAKSIAMHIVGQSDGERKAAIAFVTNPDVDESADNKEVTTIAVNFEGKVDTRVYGFGGKSKLTQEWGSRWAMARLWRMIREQYGSVE